MITDVIESLKLSVPESYRDRVLRIYEFCAEEERAKLSMTSTAEGGNPPGAYNFPSTSREYAIDGDPSGESLVPLVIAKVMMQLWSLRMYRHVEDLILTKAAQENYFEENQLILVHVFDSSLEGEHDGEDDVSGWIIRDHDDAIIDLVWNTFNMKQHFEEVRSHREWVKRAYDRLAGSLADKLPVEVVERHDLSKYAFSQAIGYTLKWVHGISGPLWNAARKLHVYNEPHHHQVWSFQREPDEEKRRKLESWIRVGCPTESLLPYGLSPSDIDYRSREYPRLFLLESFVDMVAAEWERKKGGMMDISDEDLVDLDRNYLRVYTDREYKIIAKIIENFKSSGTSKGFQHELQM